MDTIIYTRKLDRRWTLTRRQIRDNGRCYWHLESSSRMLCDYPLLVRPGEVVYDYPGNIPPGIKVKVKAILERFAA